jgi:hypothetical protein
VQVDVGYGDAVLPAPARINFPVLLDLPAPAILAYSREAVVAEKYHALVILGMANSRMKDFYDLWALARQFAFEGTTLTDALRAAFERRRTLLPAEPPMALTPVFYDDPTRQALWRALVNRNRLPIPEQGLGPVASLLRDFLLPQAAASQNQVFDAHWPAGGPWHASIR